MNEFHSYYREQQGDSRVDYTFDSNLTKKIYNVSFDPNSFSDYTEKFPTLLSNSYVVAVYNKLFQTGVPISEDERVGNTIVKIIAEFLASLPDDAVLIYHCDSSDDKQSYRHVLFEKWKERRDVKDKYLNEVIEVEIPQGDKTISHYLGYITKETNANVKEISDEFGSFCFYMIDSDPT